MCSKIKDMVGKVFTKVYNNGGYELIFENDLEKYTFLHYQDCCEYVSIEDICGDLDDLIGVPILLAEEVDGVTPQINEEDYASDTWTFYKFATIKGYVDVRWLGTSNGYYSESVDLEYTKK